MFVARIDAVLFMTGETTHNEGTIPIAAGRVPRHHKHYAGFADTRGHRLLSRLLPRWPDNAAKRRRSVPPVAPSRVECVIVGRADDYGIARHLPITARDVGAIE